MDQVWTLSRDIFSLMRLSSTLVFVWWRWTMKKDFMWTHYLKRRKKRKSAVEGRYHGRNVKHGEKSIAPWPTWEPLTVFFIVYLGSMGLEMDFESNLYFSFTKVVWHLENFSALPCIGNGNISKEFEGFQMSDLPSLKMEKCFKCLLCVSGHSEYFFLNFFFFSKPSLTILFFMMAFLNQI